MDKYRLILRTRGEVLGEVLADLPKLHRFGEVLATSNFEVRYLLFYRRVFLQIFVVDCYDTKQCSEKFL